MAYTHLQLNGARGRVADLLGDPALIFWNGPELNCYINEALRTWNSIAQYWKARTEFSTVSGTAFYDLGAQSNYSRSMTYGELVDEICDMLMEPRTSGGVWQGSDQFTLPEVLLALEQAANEFLYQTGVILFNSTQTAGLPSPPNGRLVLADTQTLDVRRAMWKPHDTGLYRHLWREDEWVSTSTLRGWSTDANLPEAYSIAVEGPITLQLMPVPAVGGTLEYQFVRGVEPATMGQSIAIPRDFTWVIKFKALANLLSSDSQVRDPQRAQYCFQRWQEGLDIAKYAMPTLLQGFINGVPVFVESLHDLDTTQPNWRNSSGTPIQMGMSGLNLLALSDVPDGVYSILVDGVVNATALTNDPDYVDLGNEFVDAVLNYARHLAHFKMGGPEFQSSFQYIETFYKLALARNAQLRASGVFMDVLASRPYAEAAARPAKENAIDGST